MRRAASSDAARRVGRGAVAALLLAALAACSAGPAPSAPSSSGAGTVSASPTAAPTATASAPAALVPAGTAADNLPYFRQVVEQVWAGADNVSGRAYIDALTAAGFDKAAMQVTADESTVGQPAESIEFSVAWRDACLVGQVGPATGDPVTIVLPLLAEGGCLLGQTRTIDW